jgi:c-di-AMP phosphodiesterase-like protein
VINLAIRKTDREVSSLWSRLVLVIGLTFSMTFASSLSKSCIDEFVNLPKTNVNFDIESFLKQLPVEIVKVKAQLKLPFGKPAD